jgi:hypothetical protein
MQAMEYIFWPQSVLFIFVKHLQIFDLNFTACCDLSPGPSSPERELYQICYASSFPYSNYNEKQISKYKICTLTMLPAGHGSKYLCCKSDILARGFHVFLHL